MIKAAAITLSFCIASAALAAQPATDTAKPAAIDPDNLVVPGKSCGKVQLGMSKDDVSKLLGQPTRKLPDSKIAPELWSYDGREQWLHLFFAGGKVIQIDYTSPAFKTEEGYGTELKRVCRNNSPFVKSGKAQETESQRYQLRSGGFSIYAQGTAVADNATEGGAATVACVHRGSRPIIEPFTKSGVPGGGWKLVGDSAGAPLGMRRLTADSSIVKDLGGGYSYCQHTDARGIVITADILHQKKIITTIASAGGAVMPLQADSKGTPVCRDLDSDGVPELALLVGADNDPPLYTLRVMPLAGDVIEDKFTYNFYGKKPVLVSGSQKGQLAVLATDDTYVYTFGQAANSPEPLVRLKLTGKSSVRLDIDEMKKPAVTPDEQSIMLGKVQRSAKVKEGVFRISQELLQAVFDLIYSGRADDAHKLVNIVWPEKVQGQWSGGPLIDRDQLWFEINERLSQSPFFDDIEKMNGDSVRWQCSCK